MCEISRTFVDSSTDLEAVLAGPEDDGPGLLRPLHPAVEHPAHLRPRHAPQPGQDLAGQEIFGALPENIYQHCPLITSPCHHLMPLPVSALMLSLLRLAWLMAAVLLLLLLLL